MELQMLCRICLEIGNFTIDGYEANVQGINIPIEKMIQRFSDIELVEGNAPEMICETCAHDLVQSYLFTEKIQEADSKILSIFYSENEEEKFPKEEQMLIEEEYISQGLEKNDEEIADQVQNIKGENSDSQFVEEVYIDSDGSEEHEDLVTHAKSINESTSYSQSDLINPLENESHRPPSTDHNFEEPLKRMYCRKKAKQNKEIHGSDSFVITQFTPSAVLKSKVDSMISDDTDEVTLSDIRTMNFETVEVKAGNMSVMTEDDQGELPIDDTRVYLCQYCPKAFSSSPFLISHVRKSHGCKYCGKMFAKSTELFQHIREDHSTFKCVVCEKDFVSNSNLRYHLKTVHKLKVPANVALLSYKK